MIAPGDTNPEDGNGSVAKPWRLCTVQQVEDLKSLIRVLPLWSSGVLVSMTVNALVSLTVLQALTMDRALGGRGTHFTIPAASMTVTVLAGFVLFAALFDRLAVPRWERLRKKKVTPLQRVGLGHVLNIASMAVAALVERRRIGISAGSGAPTATSSMSALWLVAQLALTGAEEAMHLPGNTALFYQEFPATLRSTATAMPPLFIAAGSYLSTAFVDVMRRAMGWLHDDLNRSRQDRVYWTLAVVAVVNLGYFLVCAGMYQYREVNDEQTLEE
jgi:peptide/histidine transporter 3/4